MNHLTQWVLALVDLLEVEGRILRRHAVQTGWALLLLGIAAVLLLAGAGFVAVGVHWWLVPYLGPAGSAVVVGLGFWLGALWTVWVVRQRYQ